MKSALVSTVYQCSGMLQYNNPCIVVKSIPHAPRRLSLSAVHSTSDLNSRVLSLINNAHTVVRDICRCIVEL